MAKLRRNYVSSTGKSAILVRVAVFAAILAAVANAVPRCMPFGVIGPITDAVLTPFDGSEEKQVLDGGSGADSCTLHQFTWFSVCYSPLKGSLDQVAYLLTRNRLSGTEEYPSLEWLETLPLADSRNGGVGGAVRQVPMIPTRLLQFRWDGFMEAQSKDFRSLQAEAFYLKRWRPLEEQEKRWAAYYKKLYVQAGPVWFSKAADKGGLPDAYYKAILDLSEPGWKGIGFILPQEIESHGTYLDYACSIDSLESSIGKDLFRGLMSAVLEKDVESRLDKGAWRK